MEPAAPATRGLPFLARAATWMIALYGLYYFPYAKGGTAQRFIAAFLELQARGAGALIRLFDAHAGVQGAVISGAFPLEVVRSCSSLDAQALYAATVLAFPAGSRARLLGIALGALALTALNMLRIAGLYFVGAHAPHAFDAVHEELFPLVLIAAACACLAAWLAGSARWLEPHVAR
jgi:exosortase/archaeosortase family protein